MNRIRIVAAIVLAIPLLVFGGNYFLGFFDLPAGSGSEGEQLLQAMRNGGLMAPIALSHVVIGVFLLLPRTRFAAGLLNVPMSIGIMAFHMTMLPEGNVVAAVMLGLNLLVVADRARLGGLVAAGRKGGRDGEQI